MTGPSRPTGSQFGQFPETLTFANNGRPLGGSRSSGPGTGPTTVRLPAAEVGTTAVDLLMHRLKTREHERPRKTLIRPELVVRASTGGPPGLTKRQESPSSTVG